ncbi:MAG: Aspartyl/glutamyl-tRNA(Asn/Gln) amidotransferase subunit B [Candidatus Gottesmanbacteria bacterium GW2011_GWC2_39_8]|uniref:Aspartyl/glutamyl-tRNA(Asn/Gln) amidotransferase subunit B n=1 Tax=Candidatus Gottesmanbacteria bacterium GW2011_GWC2_39_8 TaxID=1618450 RepID=A0A0G0SYS9_9BACT|nr:MAG: Aspartyl/glutamyl-tRNA(Asn/Gln) amidotransferase subunit B [Candidatus Gottesmanbacteria bacterium GW2011_GWC2_39_8]
MELKTKSKMFCGCSTDFFGSPPNTHCCPVCLGLPGALPVPNKKAIEWCVMLGMALGSEISDFSKFDRKNYFYPDLPKGYQISQYDKPFATNGLLKIKIQNPKSKDEKEKIIRIRRVHMEEDTGKLMHSEVNGEKCTLVDFNRSGMPLVEIVTEPDIRSSEEARTFLKKLHQIIRYLGISDADMEKGTMRLEPNISLMKTQSFKDSKLQRVEESGLPKYKVEVKNINSFNFAKKAIDFEIERQAAILDRGDIPTQETRGWDEKKNITYSQRSKEEAHDYRYFPEPDIPPVRWTGSQISNLKSQIPELPDHMINRFMKDYQLSEYDATVLTDEKETAEYFEDALNLELRTKNLELLTPKIIANWIINKKADITKVSPEELIKLISQKTQVTQMDEKELEMIVTKIIEANQKAVEDYEAGKEQSLMFLLGQVMRETKGKASAEQVKTKIISLLKS